MLDEVGGRGRGKEMKIDWWPSAWAAPPPHQMRLNHATNTRGQTDHPDTPLTRIFIQASQN